MPTESTGTGTPTPHDPLTYDLKNINVDTVENCNLLCKLVMDYMSTDKCQIQILDDYGESADEKKKRRSFRIVYPEGSFINYRDTNYELTYAYFYYPSRHSIDGERYDLEVNIYHGIFKERGIVAHTHYHNDDSDATTYQHKHFHYHLADDTGDDKAHDTSGQEKHTTKNVVTCLLYNMGKHTGDDVNIFFNQFIHHPDFKRIKTKELTPSDKKKFDVNVHDNWTIEKIYPKKRSYFMYDDDKNTYVIFDTIQSISKEIIDRIYERGIKGAYKQNGEKYEGFDLNSIGNYDVNNATDVLYRKNIEVITDEQYKKTKRAQIKDLLSLSRMSTYKPSKKTAKEYNDEADKIILTFHGGSNTGYLTDEKKAKLVSDYWNSYGKDNPKEININDIGDGNEIIFRGGVLKKYGYLKKIYEHFKKPDKSFDEKHIDFDEYIQRRKTAGIRASTGSSEIKTETQRNQSAFNYFTTRNDKEKVRFFFEELTPGWNEEHDIKNIIGKLNDTGQGLTLNDFADALKRLNTDANKDLFDNLIFVKEGSALSRTLSNEECQNWLSNETHYEGDLWKFWQEPVKMGKDVQNDFTSLSLEVKKKIGEGLMDYDDEQVDEDGNPITKWFTHNKCRNPGNRAAAPWCYTKNPNKRWEYCAKPYYSNILGKVVLFLIFVFIGIIAFLTIKKLFYFEYPMRFVAGITGGQLATSDTFTGTPGAAAPPAK